MISAAIGSAIFWPLYVVGGFVLDLIGLPMVLAVALLDRNGTFLRSRPSRYFPHGLHGSSGIVDVMPLGPLLWLWGNEEDGVSGPAWWKDECAAKGWPRWRATFVWAALRNPTCNLRFVPLINPVIDPARVRSSKGGAFNWQGLYAGLVLHPGPFRIWIGWKLKPEDRNGVSDDDMRKPRCGFALQFKRES